MVDYNCGSGCGGCSGGNEVYQCASQGQGQNVYSVGGMDEDEEKKRRGYRI